MNTFKSARFSHQYCSLCLLSESRSRFLKSFDSQRTSSIEDVEQAGLIINGNLFTVGIFNGRIVLIHEVVLDELDSKGRFADTSTAYKHDISARKCQNYNDYEVNINVSSEKRGEKV